VLDDTMMLFLLGVVGCTGGDKATPADDSAGDDSTPITTPGKDWTVTQISDADLGLENVIKKAPDGSLALLTWDNASTTASRPRASPPRSATTPTR